MLDKLYHKATSHLPKGKNLPKLIFLHVPKTGGTSLDRTLEALYPRTGEENIRFGAVTEAWKLAKDFLPDGKEDDFTWFQTINTILSYKVARKAPYLSGHFAISQELIEAAKKDYRFITILRNPIARWKSNYVYSRIRQAQDGVREVPTNIAKELDDYLKSPQAKKEGTKYIRYFGGYKTPDQMDSQFCIDNAITTLNQFDCIGFLENLPHFESKLTDLLEVKIKVPHLRKTETFREPGGLTADDYKSLFTDSILERINEICQPDLQVYKAAHTLVHPNAEALISQ